jgi:pyruvate,water dikinase
VDSVPIAAPLDRAADYSESLVGGKGGKLGCLIRAGYNVPPGFCVTVRGYEEFVRAGDLTRAVQMELGRKPLSDMRWEEIWDAALRIRRSFLSVPVPESIAKAVLKESLALKGPLAVRSSAPGEDSATKSHAGLHESLIGVEGDEALLDAVRVVWASLWSDAALLYRRELGLDPLRSAMAVVVQQVVAADISGVGFGTDPRNTKVNNEIVEAVPGPCSGLVDGQVDPDRWIMKKSSGEVLEWRPGDREGNKEPVPLLQRDDLNLLHRTLASIESVFGWPPDIEWAVSAEKLSLLQARPVTAPQEPGKGDEREWYLSLRPGMAKLSSLAKKVTEELIPKLEEEGHKLAQERIEDLGDEDLAGAVETRLKVVERWKRIYWEEFIPFAHGVRQLAVYYNDAVKPTDPYEFVGLLKNQPMLAVKRNQALLQLAESLSANLPLVALLDEARASGDLQGDSGWEGVKAEIVKLPEGLGFLERFNGVLRDFMDVSYDGERLAGRPDLLVQSLIEMSRASRKQDSQASRLPDGPGGPEELEQRLLEAVGEKRADEALAVIAIARTSWKLRDDDNILIGRLDYQLLRALDLSAERLRAAGRLGSKEKVAAGHARIIAGALRPCVRLQERGRESASDYRPAGRSGCGHGYGEDSPRGKRAGRIQRRRGVGLRFDSTDHVSLCSACGRHCGEARGDAHPRGYRGP